MKVLCIKDGEWTLHYTGFNFDDFPIYGNTYNVLFESDDGFYVLEEFDSRRLFCKKCFIPIQEQETEIEEISINKLENV